jgi:SulP family sulfate permease
MRSTRRVPGSVVALFLGTAVVFIFNLPLETIETKFGGIPGGLPAWCCLPSGPICF